MQAQHMGHAAHGPPMPMPHPALVPPGLPSAAAAAAAGLLPGLPVGAGLLHASHLLGLKDDKCEYY
jgi:hypothetical protein